MRDLIKLLLLFAPETRWLMLGAVLAVSTLALGMALMSGAGSVAIVTGGVVLSPLLLRSLALLRTVSRYGERLATHEAIFRVIARLRLWFFDKAVPLSPAKLGFSRGGDLLNTITADIDALDALYLRLLLPLGLLASVLVVGGVVLVRLDAGLALGLVGAVVGFVMVVAWLSLRRASASAAEAVLRLGDLRTHVVDGVEGLGELIANDAGGQHHALIARSTSHLVRCQLAVSRASAAGSALAGVTSFGLLILVVLFAPRSALVPMLFATLVLSELLAPIPAAFIHLGKLRAAAQRVFAVAETAPAVSESKAPRPFPQDMTLAFEHVSLRYDRPALVLDDVCFTVAPGERVMIVGTSGAGKSSLAALLLKFYAPTAGRITLGGEDIADLDGDKLRQQLGYLSQRTLLLSGTVRDNLLLAAPDADEATLWQSLNAVEMDEVVRDLPQGLDTWIGEGGALLSGGQARRIAMAQVVLKNAPIWLLDEPTEGLDAATAQAITLTLARLSAGRTILFITHQPELAASMNLTRVLRLNQGKIISAS